MRINERIRKDHEYNEWLFTSRWVEEEMYFYNFKDFLNNAFAIKCLYMFLTPLGVRMYRLFVFSRRYISIERLNGIWDFLNGDLDYENLTKM